MYTEEKIDRFFVKLQEVAPDIAFMFPVLKKELKADLKRQGWLVLEDDPEAVKFHRERDTRENLVRDLRFQMRGHERSVLLGHSVYYLVIIVENILRFFEREDISHDKTGIKYRLERSSQWEWMATPDTHVVQDFSQTYQKYIDSLIQWIKSFYLEIRPLVEDVVEPRGDFAVIGECGNLGLEKHRDSDGAEYLVHIPFKKKDKGHSSFLWNHNRMEMLSFLKYTNAFLNLKSTFSKKQIEKWQKGIKTKQNQVLHDKLDHEDYPRVYWEYKSGPEKGDLKGVSPDPWEKPGCPPFWEVLKKIVEHNETPQPFKFE